MTFNYQAFGLKIASEMCLSELISIGRTQQPDVEIKLENMEDEWNKQYQKGEYFIVRPNFIFFKIPKVALFCIKNGNEMKVSPFKGVSEEHLRLYILGTCMGALLLQRKILPLHGSTLAINGKAYAIIGHSGVGKSTLATNLLANGCQLLSDDVSPITFNEQGHPVVIPAYPQQKLWQESLEKLGKSNHGLRPIVQRESKFAVPVREQFKEEPLPLAAVFELVKSEVGELQVKKVQRLEKLSILYTHTYRHFLLQELQLTSWHFQTMTQIAQHIKMYSLHRPLSAFTVEELTEYILIRTNKEVVVT
ncbi:aldolase [Alkalihalobacillus pseudalcaliphilus]|uniref:aldolase n=1 Tax=Alkalihalobacillus pseudalcaliphilus TaxID=79884 RepID=UPI00064D90E5|nr:aldolase [Alkalihalobacillus pseudalcaliphilus]KMK75026.1 aldolase [Alkalihalobacillus pseudalcaliphilus]